MEKVTFVVWTVYGYSVANRVELLATFHFTQERDAREFAAKVDSGYVVREKHEIQPAKVDASALVVPSRPVRNPDAIDATPKTPNKRKRKETSEPAETVATVSAFRFSSWATG